MHWDFALILIFLGAVVPWLSRRRIRQLMRLPQTTKMDRLTLYASTVAFQWLAFGVILWRTSAHRIDPADLGLAIPNPSFTVTVSIVLSALILINQVVSLRRLTMPPAEIKDLLPQLALKVFPQDNVERLAFFALVATVAVCEEFIYRGFAQLVFQDWFAGRVALGVIGSAALFALAHLYQGRRGSASTLAAGILFSAIRAWTGSLLPSLVAHFCADLTVGMLAPGRIQSAIAKHNANEQITVKP